MDNCCQSRYLMWLQNMLLWILQILRTQISHLVCYLLAPGYLQYHQHHHHYHVVQYHRDYFCRFNPFCHGGRWSLYIMGGGSIWPALFNSYGAFWAIILSISIIILFNERINYYLSDILKIGRDIVIFVSQEMFKIFQKFLGRQKLQYLDKFSRYWPSFFL